MPAAMDVTQEPDGDPRSVQEHGSLFVLALLAPERQPWNCAGIQPTALF
jgi:hypothetical protein